MNFKKAWELIRFDFMKNPARLARRLVSRQLRLGRECGPREGVARRQRHHLLPQRGLVDAT